MNKEEKNAIEAMDKFANGIDTSCVTAKQMRIILNLIAKLQNENKALKEENAEAWVEWNNLEQSTYRTEQNLKKQLEKLRIENDKLRVIRHEIKYGTETTYLIPKERLIEINTNKYIVEIENGKFVDLKEVYQENKELKKLMAHKNWYTQKLEEDLFENASNYVIERQKIKDKIEKLKEEKEYYYSREKIEELDDKIQVLQELLEEGDKNGKNKR